MNSTNHSGTESPTEKPIDESPESLATQASDRFQWHWEETSIAGEIRKLAVASDPEGMLIDACERQDAGEEGVIDPFWATTWRAASGLDHFLYDLSLSGLSLCGLRVLELGCGTGHAGFAAACRGSQVVLTDGVTDPLLLVKMSTWELRDRCQVRQLRFGIDRIEGPGFPLILGSDITYLRTLWPELNHCLREHLAEGGQVLLSDPYRIIANEFRDWIQKNGWSYREHKVALDDDPAHPIRVMQLKAK
jgi:predicted nicotinamide N-methyase